MDVLQTNGPSKKALLQQMISQSIETIIPMLPVLGPLAADPEPDVSVLVIQLLESLLQRPSTHKDLLPIGK
jgi:hypothetical protein